MGKLGRTEDVSFLPEKEYRDLVIGERTEVEGWLHDDRERMIIFNL